MNQSQETLRSSIKKARGTVSIKAGIALLLGAAFLTLGNGDASPSA